MAGIDYNILNQIKGVQIEPPENAMMRAMQLRGMQEAAQLNALKMQEYQQQQQESNELAQIIRNPKLKYGSPEFFAEVAARAPRRYADLAAGYEKQKLGEAAEEDRRQKTLKSQFEQRQLKREFGLRKIAGANDYQSAVSLIERGIRTGEIDREEADDMLSQLHATGPNTDMAAFRSNVLTNLLPADKALTAASDVEKAQLGVSAEKQKLEGEKFEFETKQLDARRKQFDLVYPPNLIRSKEDVKNRILLQAQDPALKQLLTRFGTLEEIIARDVDEFGRDPLGYRQRLSGVPTAEILKAAEEKDKREYSQYRLNELFNRRTPLTQEDYFKQKRGGALAPVAVAADGATPVAAADGTAAPATAPLAAVAADADAAASTEKGALVGTPLVKEANPYGVELLDPEAQNLLLAAASAETQAEKEVLVKAAEKIQTEFAARRRNQEFTGTYQNVDIALRDLERLKKEPSTPENQNRIKVLQGLIDAAQVPQRPPAPTEITKKENEQEELEKQLAAETDPTKKKKLRERIKRLKADINADVFGRPSVVVQGPKPTDTALDMLAHQYIQDNKTISAVPRQLRMAVVNRATEIMSSQGISAKDMANQVVTTGQDTAAQKAVVKDFTSGKAAVATRSFNTAIDHLETMGKLATALQNGDMRVFNSVGNFFAKQTGTAAPANFEAAKSIVGGEIAKALTGANMALADRLEIRDSIIAASSPAQLQGVLNTYKQLLAGQLNSLNIQYQTGTGRDDFRNKLSPASRRELDALNPQAPASSAPRQMSTQDKEALAWANANPKDPRAAAIKKRLGVK